MSKPIYITEDLRAQWMAEFEKSLRSSKMVSGKFTFTQDVEWEEDDKAKIIFTPNAYIKMLMLLRDFNSEVAWHGIVDRRGDNEFLISDIMVYPQEVTGATVNTDQEEYTNWMMSIPTDTFNKMHMQGHSHVRMGVTPSAVDLQHQESIVQQLNGDHFYIFMIWNKSLDHNIKVYDFRENTLYEDKDCVVLVADDTLDAEEFITGAKEMVKTKTTAVPAAAGSASDYHRGSGYSGYNAYDDYHAPYRYTGDYRASAGSLAAVGVNPQSKPAETKQGAKQDKKANGKPKKSEAAAGKGQKGAKNGKGTAAPVSGRQQILSGVKDYDEFIFGGQKH